MHALRHQNSPATRKNDHPKLQSGTSLYKYSAPLPHNLDKLRIYTFMSLTLRIPLPPPPHDALIMTGYPMIWQLAKASSVVYTHAFLYTSSGIGSKQLSKGIETCDHNHTTKEPSTGERMFREGTWEICTHAVMQ